MCGRKDWSNPLTCSNTGFCFYTKFPWKKMKANQIPQKNTWKFSLWHKSRKAFMCLLLTKEILFDWLEPTPPRQGLGLVLFLFISQFPCLFSFFPLLVAARAAQAWSSIQNQQAALDPASHSVLLFETQIAVSLWTWKKLQVFSKGKGSKSPQGASLKRIAMFDPK